jgi:hypothetical protein
MPLFNMSGSCAWQMRGCVRSAKQRVAYTFWHLSKKRSSYFVYGIGIASLNYLYSMKKSVEGNGRNYKALSGADGGGARVALTDSPRRRGMGKERDCLTGSVSELMSLPGLTGQSSEGTVQRRREKFAQQRHQCASTTVRTGSAPRPAPP